MMIEIRRMAVWGVDWAGGFLRMEHEETSPYDIFYLDKGWEYWCTHMSELVDGTLKTYALHCV